MKKKLQSQTFCSTLDWESQLTAPGQVTKLHRTLTRYTDSHKEKSEILSQNTKCLTRVLGNCTTWYPRFSRPNLKCPKSTESLKDSKTKNYSFYHYKNINQ